MILLSLATKGVGASSRPTIARCFRAVAICLYATGLITSSALCAESNREVDMAQAPEGMMTLRNEYFDAISSDPERAFESVAEFDQVPGAPYFESMRWARAVFLSGQGPHADGLDVAHAYRLARNEADYDLLRHRYAVGDIEVVVTESRVFLHVAFRTAARTTGDPSALVTSLTADFLKLDAPAQFQNIEGDTRALMVSTAPHIGLEHMRSWKDRLDADVTTEIGVLIYKVSANADPRDVNPSDWFPALLRGEADN